jgi:hypothetical protein
MSIKAGFYVTIPITAYAYTFTKNVAARAGGGHSILDQCSGPALGNGIV